MNPTDLLRKPPMAKNCSPKFLWIDSFWPHLDLLRSLALCQPTKFFARPSDRTYLEDTGGHRAGCCSFDCRVPLSSHYAMTVSAVRHSGATTKCETRVCRPPRPRRHRHSSATEKPTGALPLQSRDQLPSCSSSYDLVHYSNSQDYQSTSPDRASFFSAHVVDG